MVSRGQFDADPLTEAGRGFAQIDRDIPGPARYHAHELSLAGAGLALFFSGEYRDLDLPLGWVGSLLFVAAVWFCVDAVQRIPRSEAEGEIAPGEWQAWVGVAFLGAVIVALLLSLDVSIRFYSPI